MIDTHCHLTDKKLNENIEQHITDAHQQGVDTLITLGIDVQSSRQAIGVAESHSSVYATVGIYPGEVRTDEAEQHKNLNEIRSLATDTSVVAIGETGLDKQYEYDIPMDRQIANLVEHIDLAQKLQKPLVLHSRGTSETLLEVLENNWDSALEKNIVFHCCEPIDELIGFARDHSIYIGVDGDVTYNEDKAHFVEKIPLELLVMETDAPYLLPEPLRTKKEFPNVPQNLVITAEKIAKIKGVSIDMIDSQTTKNATTLFNLDQQN